MIFSIPNKQILTSSLILICLFLSSSADSQLYINEWMASNSSVIDDADFGESGDWVELFNDFNDPISLNGYFLTDNLNNPTKWMFPDTIIGANTFLLVWLDGKNTGIHTPFKLTKAGEEIGLYDSDTTLLNNIIFKHQKTNVSMGRVNDGASDLGYFTEPTPGAPNTTHAYDGITFYQTYFDNKGGFYGTPQMVHLSTIDGEIRYTLDGSFPTEDSPSYSGPINIQETTILRAAVFQQNFITGKTITHSYFIDENLEARKLPVVSLSTDPDYFWDPEIGLYVQDFKPTWEYPINIELFENDRSDRSAFNELAGTRVNGLNSWELPQKMLGIYFDNDYDKNHLDYPLFFDRDRNKFDNFTLRASGSDWSSTLFRDGLCQHLTNGYMDLEKMGFKPSIVFINGDYLGIHNIRSRIDERFIEDNFGFLKGEYDLIENNGIVEEGDSIDFHLLFDLFDEDLTIPNHFEAIENQMDIQNFTDYFISQIWTSNQSWGHNIQMWKPKAEGSKWRWIMQDFDRGFSGAGNNLLDYFTTDNSSYNWARKPLRKMLENENYQSYFIHRFNDHLYTTFHPKRIKTEIKKYHSTIAQEIPYHVERWSGTESDYGDGIESVSFWEDEVQDLSNFAQDRLGNVFDDLQERFSLSSTSTLSLSNIPSDGGTIEINTLPVPEPFWSGLYTENLPITLTARPAIGYVFKGWSLATFETIISLQSEWKYLDSGSNLGDAWRYIHFDDSTWSNGKAQLGYGDGDENTVVSYGGDPSNKHITTYFRKEIMVENINNFGDQLMITLLKDDGAVVYLNGNELLRANMPTGGINFETQASQYAEENEYEQFQIQTDGFEVGKNVIAVEIHQFEKTSSDISFDLKASVVSSSPNGLFTSNPVLQTTLTNDTFFVANYTQIEPCLLPRTIVNNTTLTKECSPYFATSTVQVIEGVTLTIEAGVDVLFPTGANLIINGNIQVKGIESDPVQFKKMDNHESWGSILIENSTSPSLIQWAQISNASKGPHPLYHNAAISCFYGDLDIDHCTIEDVFSNPIIAYYSDIKVTNSDIQSDVTGDLINIKYGKGRVENCKLKGNNQVDTDAIDFDEVQNGVIKENKIVDFFGFNSDGIDLGEESTNVLIRRNYIHNCADKGISIGQRSLAKIDNNTIMNCSQGIAVKDLSQVEIDQTTFYSTALPIACFEKNVGLGGGRAVVTNSLFSNAALAPIFSDEKSEILVSFSLSDTDTLLSNNNVHGHPHFENPTFQDFHLMANSEAIGVGIGEVNIGTNFHTYGNKPSLMISGINYAPLGDTNAEFVALFNPRLTTINLEGYAISEGIEHVFTNGEIGPQETIYLVKDLALFSNINHQKFQWTSGRLSNSGEKIILKDPHGIIVDHVTYDNKFPWPFSADGGGDYLQLLSPNLDNHFAESWEGATLVSTIEEIPIELKIYPNPSENQITIESMNTPIFRIELFDAIGRRMANSIYKNGTNKVLYSLQGIPGSYFIIKVNNTTTKGIIKI